MKYDIIKSVSLLALFAAFTGVMFACNSSDDPSAPERDLGVSSSSEMPLYSSVTVTDVSPIRFQTASYTYNSDKTSFLFSGSATLDDNDTSANVGTGNYAYFTKMELNLVYVNESGQNVQSPIPLDYQPVTFPVTGINLREIGLSMNDPEKTLCGKFKLFINLYATNDSSNLEKFISMDSLEFEREPEFCVIEPEVSSSSEPTFVSEVELKMNTGVMSTSTFKGFSFKTDLEVEAENAEIQVTSDTEGQLTLVGLNGYKVAKYINDKDQNYGDDWSSVEVPPAPVHINDFRFTETSLGEQSGFEPEYFYVVVGPSFNAETSDDFYAVTLLEKGEVPDANGVRSLTIIYYKK